VLRQIGTTANTVVCAIAQNQWRNNGANRRLRHQAKAPLSEGMAQAARHALLGSERFCRVWRKKNNYLRVEIKISAPAHPADPETERLTPLADERVECLER
jgi:hypothetical protein